MKIGICLAGGGAKGAYQAGVIKGLNDRGINKFEAISGTSIGAINGYYIFTGNIEKLEQVWTNIDTNLQQDIKILNNTVDNSYAINPLNTFKQNTNELKDFYVNYVEIDNRQLNPKIINLRDIEKTMGIEIIKYSSLLPYNIKATLPFKEQFIKDVSEGLYDGYNLDGGLVNNVLIDPLLKKDLDKIIVISMDINYSIPEEIKKIYNVDNIIIVKPKIKFEKNDTLRFEREFCKKIYKDGYDIGVELNI